MRIQKKLFLLLFTFLITKVNALQVDDSVTTISINAIAGLQFDVVQCKVKPGAKVKLVFTNADDMNHNLIITKPGARLEVVNEAQQLEERGPAMNYIPKSSGVLWSIPVLSPNQTQSVTFIAPTEIGAYPYVCTVPGHGFVMYGVMYITKDDNLPDIRSDNNIPPIRRQDTGSEHKNAGHHPAEPNALHPYEPVPPYLYRVFMVDASPAAIAVSLPQDLSYCWDAGICGLRYAWAGGFVDNTDLWKGHNEAVAKIVGTIFYRDKTDYPLRIGKSEDIPVAEFKGYRLINRYPEFHYTLNGTDVYELILPKEDGKGLIRIFKIPHADNTVWFTSNAEDGATRYEASAGKWEKGKLKITPKQAREFTVTMTNYSLVYRTGK